jgi:hypothetical protein
VIRSPGRRISTSCGHLRPRSGCDSSKGAPRDLEARNSKTLHVNFDTAPARATPLGASAVARVRVGLVPPV